MRRWTRSFTRAAGVVIGSATLVVAALTAPASGYPATPGIYPPGSSATMTTGRGFDTCTAPSLAALRAWLASPFRTVNIYFGGVNRGCAQPNLTAAWVRDATSMGWRLLPTYFGRQPFCMVGNKPHRYTAADAGSFGTSDGQDAVARARALGLLPGSALYADVEHYDRSNTSCVLAVRRYVSAWTLAVHAAGYLAGVYVHQDSGLVDLAATYNSASYARPDAVWMARWDGNPALTGWPTASNSAWAGHQRAKQYLGDHNETWGGVTINIDSDSLDAPVATVARGFRVTSTVGLATRSGPSATYPQVGRRDPGSTLAVVCQGLGQRVGTTSVWDRLSDGSWVTDLYVSTPSKTTFSGGLPRCTYPGQVTSATALTARTGPGTSYPATGAALPPGALAWVMCQALGSPVGTSRVWNRLHDGRWVSDYYVSNRSASTWSTPVPRCP
ncbi:glycoside hydrolase domain-containing protein [Jiangella gansuensis]|uniref:glycoside hydrolase domain-containing protein n=1 Tax=Jiangella gansuensis TaxID=281473 RepID=UPI0004AC8279|nr:glycoside hydrolase domain-containing protein [Jiangella gansuensis]